MFHCHQRFKKYEILPVRLKKAVHVTPKNKSHKTQKTLLKDHRSATVTTFLQPGQGVSISPSPRRCTRAISPLQPPFKTKILLYNVCHLFGLCSTPCSSLKKFEDQVIFRRRCPRLYPQTLGRSPVQPFKRPRGHSGFPIGNDRHLPANHFQGEIWVSQGETNHPKKVKIAEWPGRKTSSPKTPPSHPSEAQATFISTALELFYLTPPWDPFWNDLGPT